MKLAARCLAALALLAFATPALPCGDKATKTTTVSAPSEKSSGAVAKSGVSAKKAGSTAKPAGESRPAAN